MPKRANPYRSSKAEQVFIYDPANEIDDRPALLVMINALWAFIQHRYEHMQAQQARGRISKSVQYANVMSVSGYHVRIKCIGWDTAIPCWIVKVKAAKPRDSQ